MLESSCNTFPMRFLKRIFLFLVVNIAIIAILTTVVSVFGIRPYLTPYGLDLTSLAIYSAIIGFAGSFISLFLSKLMAKWMMKVRVITSSQDAHEAKLVHIIQNIAQGLNMKMPEVGIYPSPEVNAFATGWSKNHALVAVSAGLLREMDDTELEGVLAHEMAHVANGDMVTMTLVQGILNTFVIFASRVAAYGVSKFLAKNEEIGYLSYYLIAIVFQIVFGILASLVVFAFSRYREFRADYGGARFVGKQKMIAALKRLDQLSQKIDSRQKSLATMKISDKKSHFGRLFSTHPSIDERIERLQRASIS